MSLFAALIVCLQDQTAEETFKKIEETIEKAKTISIRMKYKIIITSGEPGLAPSEMETKAVILLNDMNKVVVTVDPSPMFTGGTDDLSVLSDGNQLRVVDPFGWVEKGDTPRNLTRGFRAILSRTGYFGSQLLVPRSPGLGVGVLRKEPDLKRFLEQDLKKKFEVSGFEGGKDNDGDWLKYALKTGVKDGKIQVTLWYSPKTYTLVKRKLAMPFIAPGEMIYIETYDEFTFNSDIPDEKFKLPAEK